MNTAVYVPEIQAFPLQSRMASCPTLTSANKCQEFAAQMEGITLWYLNLINAFFSRCANTFGGFFCLCERGYKVPDDGVSLISKMIVSAVACQIQCEDVNECISNPCNSGGRCLNTPGGYQCICDQVRLNELKFQWNCFNLFILAWLCSKCKCQILFGHQKSYLLHRPQLHPTHARHSNKVSYSTLVL